VEIRDIRNDAEDRIALSCGLNTFVYYFNYDDDHLLEVFEIYYNDFSEQRRLVFDSIFSKRFNGKSMMVSILRWYVVNKYKSVNKSAVLKGLRE
jgi:hypothetical protein